MNKSQMEQLNNQLDGFKQEHNLTSAIQYPLQLPKNYPWTPDDIRVAVWVQAMIYITVGKSVPGSREWEKLRLQPNRSLIRTHLRIGLNTLYTELGLNSKEPGRRFTPIALATINDLLNAFKQEYNLSSNICYPFQLPFNFRWTPDDIRVAVFAQAISFIVTNTPIPGSREWEKRNIQPTRPTIRKYLDIGLNSLLIELGFIVKEKGKRFTRDELIEYLYRYEEILNCQPTADDFRSNRPKGFPSIMVYYYKFGSFQEACRLAGFDTERGYKKQFLIQRIYDFIEEFKRTPYRHELDGRNRPPGYPKGSTYDKHFGSVETCLQLLGLSFTPRTVMQWNEDNIRTIVNNEIIFFREKSNGRIPSSSEWDRLHLAPSRGIIRKITGMSMNELFQMLGYTPNYDSPERYSDDELLMHLRKFIEDEHEPPTVAGFKRNLKKYPDPINYQRRFDSWDNALMLAGIDPNSGYYGIRRYAQDGDVCDSIGELNIDNFLFNHNIPHIKDVRYAYHATLNPNNNKRCDFLLMDSIGPVYVEFAGINSDDYLIKIKEKEDLAKELSLRLIVIFPKDLKRLGEIFAHCL